MARQAKVVLEQISVPGNHTISFTSNGARDSWFDGRAKLEFQNLSTVRPENIQVEANLKDVRAYNFGYYLNENDERIYFRVTDMQYLNENNTRIFIEKDVLMTYLPTSTMLPSFIERSNDPPTSIYDSDVPELQYNGGFTYTLLDTFSRAQNTQSFFAQVSGSHEPDGNDVYYTEYLPKPLNYDGVTVPSSIVYTSMFKNFIDSSTFLAFVSAYMTAGTGDRIISAGTMPVEDLEYTEENVAGVRHLAKIGSVYEELDVSVITSINTRIAKDNVTVVIAEIGNSANQIEIPISELSTGALKIVSTTDPISQQRHYGVLTGADGDNELRYRMTINIGTSLPTANLPYYMAARNIETDLSAQQTNNILSAPASIASGAVSGAVTGSVAGGPVGAGVGIGVGVAAALASTAVNAMQNEVSAKAALEKAKRLAPAVSGVPTGFGVFANRAIGVDIFIKEPSGSGLQQMVDYYRFFGYSKSRILTPNVKTGTHFYVGNVNGLFPKASSSDSSVIRSLFNTGVWIWEDEGSFFNY